MQSNAAAEGDRTPEIVPAIRHTVPWRVTSVSALPEFRLRVTFVDGSSGEVEMSALLRSTGIVGTMFAPLRDEAVFRQVRVELGTVQWPNGVDLPPDAMYDEIKAHGRWVLE
ncbi:MAG: DUF2442 domain-containing protein [Gammaproteobacteria bacterium]